MAARKPASDKDDKPTPAEDEAPADGDTGTDQVLGSAPPDDDFDDESKEKWPVDVGETVLYRISQTDALVPLMVTAVDGETIDGVAFSADFRLIGNYRGAEPVRGARQGHGPREWRPIE